MDSSHNRFSVNNSLQRPDIIPASSHTSAAASPKAEISAYRPLPLLPTHDDDDETATLEKLSFYNISSVSNDEESLIMYSGSRRSERREAKRGLERRHMMQPPLRLVLGTDVSIDTYSSKDDSISAPTPTEGRPVPQVPGGRPLPPTPAKRPLPAIPGAIKPVDAIVLEALNRNVMSLRQSLRDATKRTTNLHTLLQIKDFLLLAQAETTEAQSEMLVRYRAAAEQGKRDT
ncbi:hypothetical protein MMC31_000451 [Peltigera leucophlebia]|nr:hypothetical protein [Peltigera leucophlebia]